MTKVINLNTHPVSVRINTPSGPDCVYLMPRAKVDLPEGASIDKNWLSQEPKVLVREDADDNTNTDKD